MEPRIEAVSSQKFIGKRIRMTFSENKTGDLWQAFMPEVKNIECRIGIELYSIQVFPPSFFNRFDPSLPFEKWAAVEVNEYRQVPKTMETFTSPAGHYAVFIHKGLASDGPKTYEYIFNDWLPESQYHLDNLPHFAVMGDQYKNNDPDSEEELWIPIRPKE